MQSESNTRADGQTSGGIVEGNRNCDPNTKTYGCTTPIVALTPIGRYPANPASKHDEILSRKTRPRR
jgi:hypothetical protein